MFSFKYIAWQFPLNNAIRQTIVYYELDNVPHLYKYDGQYLIAGGNGHTFVSKYDGDNFIVNYGRIYGTEIPEEYNKVSNFGYKALTLIQISGVVLLFVGIIWYFYGETSASPDEYLSKTATASTKSTHTVSQINNSSNSSPNRGQRPPFNERI